MTVVRRTICSLVPSSFLAIGEEGARLAMQVTTASYCGREYDLSLICAIFDGYLGTRLVNIGEPPSRPHGYEQHVGGRNCRLGHCHAPRSPGAQTLWTGAGFRQGYDTISGTQASSTRMETSP